MAKPEWGIKRICLSCNLKYYDLNKSPIICPSCGTKFDPDFYLSGRKKSLSPKSIVESNKDVSDDISDLDEIEIDTENEDNSEDDDLIEINKDEQNEMTEDNIVLDDDISFIDANEISEEDDFEGEDEVSVEISDEDKN